MKYEIDWRTLFGELAAATLGAFIATKVCKEKEAARNEKKSELDTKLRNAMSDLSFDLGRMAGKLEFAKEALDTTSDEADGETEETE